MSVSYCQTGLGRFLTRNSAKLSIIEHHLRKKNEVEKVLQPFDLSSCTPGER